MRLCPFCIEAGTKSRLYGGTTVVTCMYSPPYHDEEGHYHSHDPNHHTTSYHCSNGHRFSVSLTLGCPAPGCDHTGSSTVTAENGDPPPSNDTIAKAR